MPPSANDAALRGWRPKAKLAPRRAYTRVLCCAYTRALRRAHSPRRAYTPAPCRVHTPTREAHA